MLEKSFTAFVDRFNGLINGIISFQGKSTRIEYFVILLIAMLLLLLAKFIPTYEALLAICAASFLIISASVRRLYDINASLWYILIIFLPIAGQLLILCLCLIPGKAVIIRDKCDNKNLLESYQFITAFNGCLFILLSISNFMACESPLRGNNCGQMAVLALATFTYFAFIVPAVAMRVTNTNVKIRKIIIISSPFCAIAANLLILILFVFG